MDSPDLNEVATFTRVVQAGGFTAAARVMGVPKSTVSRRVARLEERLGLTLLQRTTRTTRLTEAGARYYERISAAVDTLEDAAVEASLAFSEPRGLVRITAPVDAGHAILVPALTLVRERFPEVRVEVDLAARVADLVGEGYDLALRGGKLADSTLVARKVYVDTARVFASPEYVARHGAPTAPEDLVDHCAVLFRAPEGHRSWRLHRGDVTVDVRVQGALIGTDYAFVRQAAVAAAGIALLPFVAATASLAAGSLVEILPEWHGFTSHLWLVQPPSRQLPARVRVVRDAILEVFSRPPWSESSPLAP